MKYWGTWFLTFGAGCMIGVVISPASWGAAIVGAALTADGLQARHGPTDESSIRRESACIRVSGRDGRVGAQPL